ncbi:MAG: glycosyltransferase [Brevundimonas sp.]|nr:glycosyltransferase [Brevundimonas sp.]
MKILQVNGYESPGRRFHGLALTEQFRMKGVDSTHIIWERDTADEKVLSYTAPHARAINSMYQRVESRLGLQSVFYTNGDYLIERPEYQDADLIHLHLVHTGYLSLFDLPRIMGSKPVVWTLHDPWAFSGHCTYSFDCERWRTGCGNCPDLSIPMTVTRDSSAIMHDLKRQLLDTCAFEVVVASSWMEARAKASPIFQGVPVHRVPFGLNLEFFGKGDRVAARHRFGIPEGAVVIGFRSQVGAYKGFEYIDNALAQIESREDLWLLTTASTGLLERHRGRFGVVELGWTNDDVMMRDFYAALDIFLMPSVEEAFGVMAIEAMASSCPVIVFEGTALPEVTRAPDVGIQVANRDWRGLATAIQRLIDNPEERDRRGQLGRRLVEHEYDEDVHVQRMVELYEGVIKRFRTPRGKRAKV